MDLDKSGFGFQRVRTYLGPSLGWIDELVQPTTEITVGGTYVVQPGESMLLVDVAAGVIIQLPDVAKWVQQTAYQPATGFERAITIKDIGGNAANFNIVVAPHGQQAIDGLQQSFVISQARANCRLTPLIDLTGWAIETNSGVGGGGGGGDVFKAGNNTFTGVNTFENTITAPTVATGDNSINVATTAFVKVQGYITGAALTPYALIASPTFTGDPKAPTPAPGDNDTSLATTAFVTGAINALPAAAPATAQYGIAAAVGSLPNARVFTDTPSIAWDISTPGQIKANTAAGGGNVSSSGTPVNGQLARWVTPTTIEGVDGSTLYAPIASPLFTGDPRGPTPATADNDTSLATTAFVKANLANFQPLDGDLTALSGLLGTNTIYYRSGVDTWSPVTYSGLSFSGGVLTVTAGGGNVNSSGTPVNGQWAQWTDATHIQGVATAAMPFVELTGDTMSGDLTIAKTTPILVLNATGVDDFASFRLRNNGLDRWVASMGGAESGGNVGANFAINRYDDAGVFLDVPFIISRSNGSATFSGNITVDRSAPAIGCNAAVGAGNSANLNFLRGNSLRWNIQMVGNTEPGGNVGSELQIWRCNDAGVQIDQVLSVTRNNPGVAIRGTNTNDDAPTGFVGEFVEGGVSNTTPVAIAAATWTVAFNITLTPGDWDVFMHVNASSASAITAGYLSYGGSPATADSAIGRITAFSSAPASGWARSTLKGRVRVVSGSQPVYCNVYTDSASNVWGSMNARRAR